MMNRYLIALFVLAIWGCANVVPPTGGPKEIQPPILIASIPKDGNTNVHTIEITLVFDELVVIKNIKKQLLITPRIDFDYKYKIKKNNIILTLDEPLDSATTYTFNFRNSIVDITEGNPAENLIIAFSTGPILDTLQLAGNIIELLNEKTKEELIVGLYKENDTLDLFNSPPYYLANTDENGNYTFRNIKPSTYKLYAFDDKNKNLTCESEREAYAFLDKSIFMDTSFVADTLKLQNLNINRLILKRTRNSGQYFTAATSKYLTHVSLKAANDSTLWYSQDEDGKEIKIYNTLPIKDSLLVEISMLDSMNNSVKDSFYLSFPASERKFDEYNFEAYELQVFPKKQKLSFIVTTSKPSKFVYQDSIKIQADSLNIHYFDSTWNITVNDTHTEFKFANFIPNSYLDSIGIVTDTQNNNSSKGRVKPTATVEMPATTTTQRAYNLILPKGTFQSIEMDSSKTISIKIQPKYDNDFGILTGEIKTTYTHYIIQLLNKDYKVIDEKGPGTTYKFSQIPPGDYMIRLMIDIDHNNRWDAGNILLNKLPEPVIIYKDKDGKSTTTIRANWELSLDLQF